VIGGLRARRAAATGVRWGTLTVFGILLAFPFYWMLITSFKRTGDLYDLKNNPFIFNQPPTLEHLKYLFRETLFLRWLGNTAFAGLCVVAITVLLAAPAAYALARLTGRWGERLGIGIFLTYLVPPTLLFIPLSRIVAWLGLQDTLGAIIKNPRDFVRRRAQAAWRARSSRDDLERRVAALQALADAAGGGRGRRRRRTRPGRRRIGRPSQGASDAPPLAR